MATQAQRDAVRRYDKENSVQYAIKLNRKTDADLIEAIEQAASEEGGKQGFIKACIRRCLP